MRVVDANVLIYAVNADAQNHEASRRWLDRALSGSDTVGFTWLALTAFVRLVTKPGLFAAPLHSTEAVTVARAWLDSPSARILEPTHEHLAVLDRLLTPLGAGGNLVSDAHLAAIAIEHRAEVVTFDSDFGRFDGVRWKRPDELS